MVSKIKYRGIDVKIVRKRTNKNIVLRAQDENTLKISVPSSYTKKMVTEFLISKDRSIEKLLKNRKKLKIELEDGNFIKIFSKKYKILNLKSDKNKIVLNKDVFLILSVKDISKKEKEKLAEEFLKKILKKEAEKIIPIYEKNMGKKVGKLRVKKLNSRWGSINILTGDINLNYQLVFLDKDCLEYVVVHEISHLYEKGHNDRFYKVVKSYFPEFEKTVEKLSMAKIYYF